MAAILIWRPKGSNKYGHVAMQTEKYHMSLWPDGRVKEDLSSIDAAGVGVKAGKILQLFNF
jgi:hypothetical protein